MLSPLRIARLTWHALRLMRDPTNLPAVFGIVDAVNTKEQLAEQRAYLASHPHVADAMARRLRITVDLERLAALPPGTLGRTFADFIHDNELEPAVLTDRTANESEWVSIHMYETHDLLHVLIDADTSPLGEVQLQSFLSSQMPMERLAPVALAVAFARAALGHELLTPGTVLNAVARGQAQGAAAQLLFGVDWNARWEQDLGAVRREMGLSGRGTEPASPGATRVQRVQRTPPRSISATQSLQWVQRLTTSSPASNRRMKSGSARSARPIATNR
jgi:ubiquinone biosynthesis protein COQ4